MGTPEEVYAEPGTEFVARFLGFENVLQATVDADGGVATAVGRWQVSGAEAGAAMLLLRPEGVQLAEGAGDEVVVGTVVSRLFQGASQRVRLEHEGQALQFDLPAGAPVPAEGETIAVRVPRVQLLQIEA